MATCNGAREFVQRDVLPVINDYWERAEFPWPLVDKLGQSGLVGDAIEGYGCPPMDALSAGLIHMELSRGDGSLSTFLGVHSGLAMKSIAMLGSEEHKQRLLPAMARLEKIGAFALTEPNHGSDSIALETSARRDGDSYVLNGTKKWIGNGSIADVVVVWARDTGDEQVKGFLVDKGTPGLSRPGHRGQGLAARGLAGRDRTRRRSGAGREPPARSQLLSRHGRRARRPPGPRAPGWRWATPSPAMTRR